MKRYLSAGIVLAVAGFALVLVRHGQRAGGKIDPPAPAAAVHGESINIAALPEPPSAVETPTNATAKRRHPKPPSVQRRMVMAQLAQSDPANSGVTSMVAGTAGTAADLAKTNLMSASSLPALQGEFPGYHEVSFSVLSGFDFPLTGEIAGASADPAQTAAKVGAQIPKSLQSLDGREVVIQGFLLPVRMDDGLAVEFLLMRSQSMCCYGVPPKINEWITVQMTGKGVKPVMDQLIAVAGTLHVGPTLENGLLTGIYRLDGEKVFGPFALRR